MKYQLAVFDMDGTILDTLEDLKDSMNYTLREYGYPERTLDEIRQFVGNGLRLLVKRAAPQNTSEETIDEMLLCLEHYYKDHCAVKTKPYNGIPEVIRTLRENGVKTAVVSNKVDFGVQALCKQYFDGLFDYAVGEKAGVRKKPAPDSVNEVLKVLGFTKEDAVYIGDSDVDLATARNASLPCIAVEWGFRDRDFLLKEGATLIVKTPDEIAKEILV